MGDPRPRPGVAVVGCGTWGGNHLRVWGELGHLRAACDVRPAALEAVVHRYPGVACTPSFEDVLADPGVDAVVIATPAPTHATLTAQALDAGKDVLVEKPLALRVDQAEDLAARAEKRGAVLMVGHVVEYHPAFVRLAELVHAGDLGTVRYVYATRVNLGTVRTEESALWSFAPHDIALLLRIVGSEPTEVACHGGAYLSDGVADVTVMTLSFAAGIRAHVFVSWLHPFKEHRFVVVGERQMAIVDDTAPWPDKLVLYPHSVDWADGRVPVARRAEAVPVALDEGEPLRLECEHFLARIADRRPPLTDAARGVAVVRVLAAGEKSLGAGGAPVRLEPESLIHPTATVDPGAVIGEGTRVWHYSHVMGTAVVGRDGVLGQNTFVGDGVRIGDRVRIQNNVSVFAGVELEDDVFCGPGAVFTNVRSPRADVNRAGAFEATLVRQGATLGANCTIVCGTTVGRWAFVAAGAVVTHDVPDHALAAGVPARITGWRCQCGEALERGACAACGRTYPTDAGGAVLAGG